MGNKLITDAGKSELLRLGFASEQEGGAFKFLALGGEASTGAQGETFDEISSSDGYERVQTEIEINDKSINITGTFSEENYAPAQGGTIREIGLCNSSTNTDDEIFFLYSEVPEIKKTGDISLEYTIVLSID